MPIDPTTLGWPSFPAWWPDIEIGVLFLLFGVAGAAVMVFMALSNWESVMGKTDQLRQFEADIKAKRDKADKEEDVRKREIWERMIDSDENQLQRERKMLRNYGVLLYLVVGSIIAMALARNALEAIWIGASWTSILGLIGIKADDKARERLRDTVVDEQLKAFESEFKKLQTKSQAEVGQAKEMSFYTGFSDALARVSKSLGTPVDKLIAGL